MSYRIIFWKMRESAGGRGMGDGNMENMCLKYMIFLDKNTTVKLVTLYSEDVLMKTW